MVIEQSTTEVNLIPNSNLKTKIYAIVGISLIVVFVIALYFQARTSDLTLAEFFISGLREINLIDLLTLSLIPLSTLIAVYIGWFYSPSHITINRSCIVFSKGEDVKTKLWSEIAEINTIEHNLITLETTSETMTINIGDYITSSNAKELDEFQTLIFNRITEFRENNH